MNGRRRFDVIEHLSEAELDTAINEAQKADEPSLVRRLCFVKNLYAGVERLGEALNVGGGSVVFVTGLGEDADLRPVVLSPRAVDERIDRAVGTGNASNELDFVVGCLVNRGFGERHAIGDTDRRFVGIEPLVESADQLGVPGLVVGVPVEDLSEDGNAGSVDTEAGFELPEIAAVVGAVAMPDFEGIVVGLGLIDA